MRAATVLCVKAVVVFYEGKADDLGGCRISKRLLIAHHGVENGKHLAHTGFDDNLLLLASFHQVIILSLQDRVVTNAGQGGHIERTAHIRSATLSLAIAAFPAAVPIDGCDAHQCCNLLAVQLSQLWQISQQGGRCHSPDRFGRPQ